MIELPETYVLARELNETVRGKTIARAEANVFPHAFAWYTGDPAEYGEKLAGRRVTEATPGTGYTCGGNTELLCGDMLLVLSTAIRYHEPSDPLPAVYQLFVGFTDGSFLTCTVRMWGAMFCHPAGEDGLPAAFRVNKSPTPLENGFDERYFADLLAKTKPTLSAKAFLATEQRVPGLGNGVLQDILFNARIHPRTLLRDLNDADADRLFASVKTTLRSMTDGGGRDTERDLFGRPGGYRTLLSSKTANKPCPVCGAPIERQAFLGGNVYFCPSCQPHSKGALLR